MFLLCSPAFWSFAVSDGEIKVVTGPVSAFFEQLKARGKIKESEVKKMTFFVEKSPCVLS